MVSLDCVIFLSEHISDNVLASAMAAIFGQGGMACLKDTAPPWSKKAMMFWQGL